MELVQRWALGCTRHYVIRLTAAPCSISQDCHILMDRSFFIALSVCIWGRAGFLHTHVHIHMHTTFLRSCNVIMRRPIGHNAVEPLWMSVNYYLERQDDCSCLRPSCPAILLYLYLHLCLPVFFFFCGFEFQGFYWNFCQPVNKISIHKVIHKT